MAAFAFFAFDFFAVKRFTSTLLDKENYVPWYQDCRNDWPSID